VTRLSESVRDGGLVGCVGVDNQLFTDHDVAFVDAESLVSPGSGVPLDSTSISTDM
jgi:hypothetical protein